MNAQILLSEAVDRLENEILGEHPDAGLALHLLAEALTLELVVRGEITGPADPVYGPQCRDCGRRLLTDGEEHCRCEQCPDCEAPRCVCRWYAGSGPATAARQLDLAAVLAEVRRLRGLL